jgi:hypothetical protein
MPDDYPGREKALPGLYEDVMAKLHKDAEQHRAMIEDAMSRMGMVPIRQQELDLRIGQAIQRDGSLEPLLRPALELTREIRQDVQVAQRRLGEYHQLREQDGW